MSEDKIYNIENSLDPVSALVERRKRASINTELLDEPYNGIENCIGKISVPVGIAGPFEFKDAQVFVPLATTESALVASVNRGAKFMQGCEIDTYIVDHGITRAPAFMFGSNDEAEEFLEFLNESVDIIKEIFESDSEHLKLLGFDSHVHGDSVFVRFSADSGDAMGMNMITIAVDKVVKEFLLSNSPVKIVDWVLSSNVCTDKKVSRINADEGRGFRSAISVRVSKSTFDVEEETLVNVYSLKYVEGSEIAGLWTSNGHLSNMIAAMFLAFGQDLGHVVDCSQGEFLFEVDGDDYVFTLDILNLLVGIHGGGTDLPHIRGFLNDCNIGSREDLVELISRVCLAGEISLFIALAEHNLASAHKDLRDKS